MRERSVDAVVTRVRKHVLASRARLQDFFAVFDPLNRKRISKDQLARGLDAAACGLSKEEVAALVGAYARADGLVDYLAFCDDVDAVFTRKGLESDPGAELANPFAGVHLHEFGQKLEEKEETLLQTMLERFRHAVETRGLIVKDFFADFDRLHTGYTSKPQFARKVQQCFGVLPEAELNVLIKAYTDGHNVNYKALHIDVTPDAVSPGRTLAATGARTLRKIPLDGGGPSEFQEILDNLIKQTATSRIRVMDAFREFDPMRTGRCTAAQFKRGLGFLKFRDLSERGMAVLEEHFYDSVQGKVKYAEFVAEVDAAFTRAGLEVDPTATLDCHARDVATRSHRGVNNNLSPAEAEAATRGLEYVRDVVDKKRVELVPLFNDFDLTRSGYCTPEQLLRVLKTCSCLPLSRYDAQCLAARYTASGAQAGKVDYRVFIYDVEPARAAAAAEPAVIATGPTIRHRSEAAPVDVAVVLRRLKVAAKRDRIRVAEFLQDFDKLRLGLITAHQLETGLSSAGFTLSPAEYAALADAFADARALDPKGKPMVAWSRLVDDIDSAVIVKGLESNPDLDVDAVASASLTQSLASPPVDATLLLGEPRLTAEEEAGLRAALARIQGLVSTRRLQLGPFFQDFDRTRRGVLPLPQFLRALDRVSLTVTPAESDLLVKAFNNCTRDRTDVNYKWFVDALSNPDEVLAALPGASERPHVAGHTGTAAAQPKLTIARKHSDRTESVDVDAVLARLQEAFAGKRVSLRRFLQENDRLRSGKIPSAKLNTAFALAGAVLSPAEIAAVAAKYTCPTDATMVEWRELAAFVDGGSEELEKDPTLNLTRTAGRTTHAQGTVEDAERLNALLQNLAHFVLTRNLLVKPTFQSYDPHRHNTVTKHQFAAVLNTLKMPVTPKEVQLLQAAFAVPSQPGTVQYLDFCKQIDASLI